MPPGVPEETHEALFEVLRLGIFLFLLFCFLILLLGTRQELLLFLILGAFDEVLL